VASSGADPDQTLIVAMDDATSNLLYAQLWPQETTEAIMTALKAVIAELGVPLSLYNDRAGWAFYSPKTGEKVSKTEFTQVGRALDEAGVEHIPAYSPQARGRSERVNRTLQDRLVNELKAAGIREVEAANEFIRKTYMPGHNQEFGHSPKDPTSCFISAKAVNLDDIFCIKEQRVVSKRQRCSLREPVLPDRKAARSGNLCRAERRGASSPRRQLQRCTRHQSHRALRPGGKAHHADTERKNTKEAGCMTRSSGQTSGGS